jgi:two-component system, NarL family, sensor histidine kinase UhpB
MPTSRKAPSGRARTSTEARLEALASCLPGLAFELVLDPHNDAIDVRWARCGPGAPPGIDAQALLADGAALLSLLEPAQRPGLLAAIKAGAGAGPGGGVRWEGPLAEVPGAGPVWVTLAATASRLRGRLLVRGVVTDATARRAVEESIRTFSAHVEALKERERTAIAREIHDEIGGSLTAVKFDLAWVGKHVTDPVVAERIQRLGALVDAAARTAVRIMRNIRPSILDQGLVAALEWHVADFGRRTGITARFASNREEVELPEESSLALYRVCQEALTNVSKHADARQVEVNLFAGEDAVSLEVSDDGIGLEAGSLPRPGAFGLLGMRERAESLGGWLDVSGAPQRGTTLMLSIPWSSPRSGRPA